MAADVQRVKFGALTLTKVLEDDKANLNWSIRGSYPRITVFTSTKTTLSGKFDYDKMIIAPFDYISVGTLLDDFEKIINGGPGVKTSVECVNKKWVNNVITDETYVQAKVTVGKDQEGVVYMAVTAEGKPKIKFNVIKEVSWNNFIKPDETPYTPAELSVRYAKAYTRLLRRLLDATAIADIVKNNQDEVDQLVGLV